MSTDEVKLVNTLTFREAYKSIKSMDSISLPGLVIVTGINGSGKTHLLTAIKGGQVLSSIAIDPNSDIKIYDATNIVPLDTGVFDPYSHWAQRSSMFQAMQTHRDALFPGLKSVAKSLGVHEKNSISLERLVELTEDDFFEGFEDKSQAENNWLQFQQQINNHAQHVMNNTFNHNGDESWRNKMRRVAVENPRSLIHSSSDQFYRNAPFLWGDVDPFQQAFGQVFVTYRKLLHDNEMYKSFPPPTAAKEQHLSREEFIEVYGPPPWDFVNRILEESKLNFRVDSPPLYESSQYEPKLTKVSSDVEMRFQDLSSGEKVLMSFALCLYNTQETRQKKEFPKLLLLDEIDGPLHPSMAASLLATINNVLVKERNVAVIMTTHSPSTVALAPEDSVYVMDPTGPRLVKSSKGAALSILTAGVPTLSVSFDGRRQVFVESFRDAKIYDSLYQKYKGHLNTERSLAFVEVGRVNSEGIEQNSGCTQVIRIVGDLAAGGNHSVLGLVDWDGGRKPTNRVHVLSHGVRNGLESLLYDPLLLLSLLVRENCPYMVERGLFPDNESYTSIATWGDSCWQEYVDKLQSYIFSGSLNTGRIIDIKYLSGISLRIRQDYLYLDDHRLEEKLISLFGFIKPKAKGSGLMQYIIDTVLKDHPGFVPKDLISTFESLLGYEVHSVQE